MANKITFLDNIDKQQIQTQINALKTLIIATEHGISTESDDNTPALQALVDSVHAAGGGTIYFPIGTYKFAAGSVNTIYKPAIVMRSNVSIVGENIEKTVFKQITKLGYPMFWSFNSLSNPITGCSFSNFTVDAYDTGNANLVQGKAFHFQYVRNCVFRDLILKGTIATAMGIDYIDQVVIDNVNCIDCGRTYTGVEAGTSGIGIGSGCDWGHENFIITNCTCVRCGQYGIFIEDQRFLGGYSSSLAKGNIITNCIVRDGLNNGIGVRGASNITVSGCEVYGNAKHGLHIDGPCVDVKVTSCGFSGNGKNGACIEPSEKSETIAVKNCVFTKNTESGIKIVTENAKLCIADNHTDGNLVGLEIGEFTLNDCVLKNNTLLDDADVNATFTGNIGYNDFAVPVSPTGILAQPLYIELDKPKQLVYRTLPSNANKSVTFETANSGIATVDVQGFVTGHSIGNTTITIRSVVNTAVYTEVEVSVMQLSVTVPNNEMITGKMINNAGVETSVANGAATDYIKITGGDWLVKLDGWDWTSYTGARVALYDINKTFLTAKTFIGGQVMTDCAVVGHEDAAYLRAGVNQFNSSMDVELRKAEMVEDNVTMTAGKKIELDGTVTDQSNSMCSDFIDISDFTGTYWYAWTAFNLKSDTSITLRAAFYDENQNPIPGSITSVAYDSSLLKLNKAENAKYVRICLRGVTSQYTCQIFTTEVEM